MATSAASTNAIQISPMKRLKDTLSVPSVQEQFRNALAENAPLFIASLIDVYGGSNSLQKCDPNDVIMEALKAATLKLPINKSLGFAYIVPYKGKPQMQIGWKGYVQLAARTGQYKIINAGPIYEGQNVRADFLTGNITISSDPTSDNAIGYFAYIELINGFTKSIYWSKEKVHKHAKKYSQNYDDPKSTWKKNPDEMCTKTVLSNLLRKYGMMSVDMESALNHESDYEAEIRENANQGEVIDIKTGEVIEEQQQEGVQEQPVATESPGF